MEYPKLYEINTSRQNINVFGGYNHNLRISDGEFYDMENLSSDNYPILSTRRKRGVYAIPDNPRGIIAKDSLCYVDGRDFVIGEDRVADFLSDDVPKRLVSMGAYVIIFPDKKYINTVNAEDRGDIDASYIVQDSYTIINCKEDGSAYDLMVESPVAPAITEAMEEDPNTIPTWINTGHEVPPSVNSYSIAAATWIPMAAPYIKITSMGIGEKFAVGDFVRLEGWDKSVAGVYADGMSRIHARDSDYIVVNGVYEFGNVSNPSGNYAEIHREMPTLDFVVESGNRLWGCHYGVVDGEMVNTIYASKLGDFKNWNCFQGLSTDSYAVSVGTDGEFTGAATHLNYPIFFKENSMHKVYGNYPANYQVQTTECRGVMQGCHDSIATVNETLFYKSRSGVCIYDGSLPQEISIPLGEKRYHSAVAGGLDGKYYISMADSAYEWHLFVYDAFKGMWHREDDTQATAFSEYKGDLYYIDYADNQIKTVKGTGTVIDDPIHWMAETGIIGVDSPDKTYISCLNVRMSLELNSRATFSIEYDSSEEWEHLFTMTGDKLQSFTVPIRPKRCDHMRIRIVGIGGAKIFSVCKTIEQGSDM